MADAAVQTAGCCASGLKARRPQYVCTIRLCGARHHRLRWAVAIGVCPLKLGGRGRDVGKATCTRVPCRSNPFFVEKGPGFQLSLLQTDSLRALFRQIC